MYSPSDYHWCLRGLGNLDFSVTKYPRAPYCESGLESDPRIGSRPIFSWVTVGPVGQKRFFLVLRVRVRARVSF